MEGPNVSSILPQMSAVRAAEKSAEVIVVGKMSRGRDARLNKRIAYTLPGVSLRLRLMFVLALRLRLWAGSGLSSAALLASVFDNVGKPFPRLSTILAFLVHPAIRVRVDDLSFGNLEQFRHRNL